MKKIQICVLWIFVFAFLLSGCQSTTSQTLEQDVVSPQPEHTQDYVQQGDASIASGETEENLTTAQENYEKALALDAASASAYLGLADVYIRKGDYDKALEILQQGLEKTGGNQSIADKIAEIAEGDIKDSFGNLRRRNGYDSNRELAWYHLFSYNELGQQISVTSYNAEGTQTGYMEIPYNEEGQPLKMYSYLVETGELDGYSTYQYDSNGNVVKSEYSKLGEAPNQYEVFEYNDDGICKSSYRYQYDAEGDFLMTSSKYNNLGNVTKITWYDPYGNIRGYYIYEYDNNGNCIQYKNYDVDGTLRGYAVWIYDDYGKYIGEELYDGNGSLISSTVNES